MDLDHLHNHIMHRLSIHIHTLKKINRKEKVKAYMYTKKSTNKKTSHTHMTQARERDSRKHRLNSTDISRRRHSTVETQQFLPGVKQASRTSGVSVVRLQ